MNKEDSYKDSMRKCFHIVYTNYMGDNNAKETDKD
jgi:hypothetical protein